MKQILILFTILIFAIPYGFAACTDYAWNGGNGAVENPYGVQNCSMLEQIGKDIDCLNKSFQLTQNIDCSDTVNWDHNGSIYLGFSPIGNSSNKFSGNFDGQDHTITGIYINRPASSYIGMFGYIYLDASDVLAIKDLGLENVNISGYNNVGGLAGRIYVTDNSIITINNYYSTGKVESVHSVGGLIGYAAAITSGTIIINNSYSTCVVNGSGSMVGGLVGYSYASAGIITINNCYSIANVKGGGSAGGLVGGVNGGGGYPLGISQISNSYSTGNVNGDGDYVGGLVGYNIGEAKILNCYATGNVNGDKNYVGGLAGMNKAMGGTDKQNATINNSYSTGNVSGSGSSSYVGGFVGKNEADNSGVIAAISNCYATGNVDGYFAVGGFAGSNYAAYDSSSTSIIRDSYSTGSVSGAGQYIGSFIGYQSSSWAKNYDCYWNNHAGNPGSCVREDNGVTSNCVSISDNESYFYSYIGNPMSSWDFTNIWSDSNEFSDHAVFQWQLGAISNEPIYSNFISEETTNFSEVNVTNVINMSLAITGKGKIKFGQYGINAEGADFDKHVKIEDSVISVNTSALDSSLNNSATLTFENINCNFPYVYYSDTEITSYGIMVEDNLCLPPRCTNIQCSTNTLTVDVLHFSGYAVNGTANLTIDADDPKYIDQLVTFTAEYRNDTDPITGATCNISFSDGSYIMDGQATYYNYSRSFSTADIFDYNVTCNHTDYSTVFANDTAEIQLVDIPEFSMITLGLGMVAVLAGFILIRKKK